MRLLLLTLFVMLFSIAEAQAGNGSFLILKRVYFYINANQTGKRHLTRTPKAYEVVDVTVLNQKSIMYKLIVPENENYINGSGFIVETDSELQKMEMKPVKVYPKVLSIKSNFLDYQLVSPDQLSFTGRQEQSSDFPHITWKAVNFKTQVPNTYWVPDWSGIYRPNKNADWLNQTYQKATRLKMGKDIRQRILLGLVETGFTREQVEMALGAPLKTKQIENGTQEEWQYSSHKVIFKSDRVLRVI
ncbi:MAG: hypothetical protein HN580_27650 [Deltaproteobacteria bacterium]|jgi:hypothetical protein|nr:hypothetical protein [Deltaproteobacteria bacterium]MBT4090173.1 hypothetical protein [Deltaproteobacteria bacterium]MBT4265755.1 hypothetical protein [Deltaproteobacteria bacterium]MBT4640284.1 hypothetical protein [Deltaproteobacteria bacterium]MBT6500253.1 hypothetical protein [Deltaproteobacteria bacterium]